MENTTYQLLPIASTYADAVHGLRAAASKLYKDKNEVLHPVFVKDDGSRIFRPLTFKENLTARVEDFETLKNPDETKRTMENRLTLFKTFIDSCTGRASRGRSTKFKIVPLYEGFVTAPGGYSMLPYTDLIKTFIDYSVNHRIYKDYESLDGIELDSSKAKYDKLLTEEEVLGHPAWNAAVEGDKNLLKTYTNIIFKLLKKDKAMAFNALEYPEYRLRALCIGDLDGNSSASGNYDDFDCSARLLLAQPKE